MKRFFLFALLIATLLTGCAVTTPDVGNFLARHRQTLDLQAGLPAQLPLLDEEARDARVILLGEHHGVAVNEELNLALLRHLHEQAGVRTYLAEVSPSQAYLLNRYLETGDEALLQQIFEPLKGTFSWTEERYAFWQALHAFNASLPQEERVAVAGLDLPFQTAHVVRHLRALQPEGGPPAEIAPTFETLAAVEEADDNAVHALLEELQADIEAHPHLYSTYLGEAWPDFERATRSLEALFIYWTTEEPSARQVFRVERMAENFQHVAEEHPGPYYGMLGRNHVLQGEHGGLQDFAARLSEQEVVSLLLLYDNSRRLTKDDEGRYRVERFSDSRRWILTLRPFAPGALTLFRLTGEDSPFDEAIYFIEGATDGEATTDYLEFVIVARDAAASTPLER
ncbi:MAG: erythromycin esterase family protein [Anaerolineales bacterium]